jgi:hypothetical protein
VSLTWSEAEKIPLIERLRPMAALLPAMEAPGATWGGWSPSQSTEPGVVRMPIWLDSELAAAFVSAAYERGWVIAGFDWSAWDEGRQRGNREDWREWLASADAYTLARFITALVRSDRFCEGSLSGAFDSGVLTAIVRRMSVLLEELTRTP